MNLHDVFLRIRALTAPRRVERELDEELAFHIERETQRHLAEGLSAKDARTRALACFGPVALAADQCRDARGTAFVDTLARDVLYAFRSFRRAPLAALTIVATVALGLGLVAAVFAVYSMIFLRADAVRSPGELFAVERDGSRGDEAFTRLEYEAIREETSVFTDVVAMLRPVMTHIEGRRLSAALVTGNFFQTLGVQAALGRALMPADEQLAARPVIVLSHHAWNRLFAGNPTAIGRTVYISGRPYEVVGVMPQNFRGLAIAAPDYWAPLALAGQVRDAYAGGEDRIPAEIIGRLKPGMSPEAATAGLVLWASAHSPGEVPGGGRETATGRPISITLRPRPGNIPADMLSLMAFSPIFFAFGLILMIGCANVANLLLARGVSRQREIGIRLSLGASRRRIVRQLLTENLLLALAAGSCGLAISRQLLAGGLYLATATLPPELLEVDLARFAPATDWRVAVFMLAGAIASTAFFGLMPALQTTRLDLVRAVRGEVTRDARPGRARQVLIAVQVGASALLLVCAATFLRGALDAATADPGVRTSDTVRLSIANEPRRSALLQAVTADPTVVALAASSQRMRAVAETSASATGMAGRSPSTETMETSGRVSVELLAVSPEYFDVLGIDVVSGRGFTQAERHPDAGVVVLHETIARQLWPNRSPLGNVVRLDATQSDSSGVSVPSPRAFTVVGIARDPGAYNMVLDFRGVYLPTSSERTGTWLYLRVHGDPERTRQALLSHLTEVDPDLTITTMRAMAGVQTYVLRCVFWVSVALGGLGLLLTVSGLFSVLSYVVEQRAKEIGVRVALGATIRNVVGFVLSQSLRPVGLGLLAGSGLAVALAIVLMSTPAASEIGGTIRIFDPLAYVASMVVIVTGALLATSVPALRAARLDPIATLRQD
jgi:predicted permease